MRWVEYFFVSTASPVIHKTFFVKIGWRVRVKCTQGKIFFCKHSFFFAKIAWCISSNFQRGEFNLFLWEQQAHPPLWPFFCQNCMACESQTYEVNPILFCESSKPTRPYNLFFFLRTLHGMWESNIWSESNPYLQMQQTHQPLWYGMAHKIKI